VPWSTPSRSFHYARYSAVRLRVFGRSIISAAAATVVPERSYVSLCDSQDRPEFELGVLLHAIFSCAWLLPRVRLAHMRLHVAYLEEAEHVFQWC
jgi:hypothetical protein